MEVEEEEQKEQEHDDNQDVDAVEGEEGYEPDKDDDEKLTGSKSATPVWAGGAKLSQDARDELLALLLNAKKTQLSHNHHEYFRGPLVSTLSEELQTHIKTLIGPIWDPKRFARLRLMALSFALENLNVPVLLVGSQRSSDR